MYRISVLPLLLTAAILAKSIVADLPFDYSYVQECIPLNITWTPESDAYPYSVYILAVGAQVQSWQINSNYQPGSNQLTFQYQVPQISQIFQTFMISVVDAKGNGNSSAVLTVNPNSDKPSSCPVYSSTNAWTYASDSVNSSSIADRPQCGSLKYYPVGSLRGTSPYSISIVPTQGIPYTVNVPQSATTNQTYFVWQSPLVLKQGTSFYQFMSDGTGAGSGGGSPIYSVSNGPYSDCLSAGYKIQDLDTVHALPVGSVQASFSNLSGAISASNNGGGSSSSIGGLIGGIIGAVIGVGGILVIIALYLVYRRRQKRKRELERKEQPQFIDLDDEAFDPSRRRSGGSVGRNGVRQTYSVSPFTYQPANNGSPDGADYRDRDGLALMVAGEGGGTLNSINTPDSEHMVQPLQHASYSRDDGLQSPGSEYGYIPNRENSQSQALLRGGDPHSSASQWNVRPSIRRQEYSDTRPNASSVYSTNHLPTGSGGSSSSGPFGMSAAVAGFEFGNGNTIQSSTDGTMNSSSYVLRARNADDTQGSQSTTGNVAGGGALPAKSMAAIEAEERNRGASSRFVQHQDAGRLAVAPGTEDEELQEDVPPEYGQWLNNTPKSKS